MPFPSVVDIMILEKTWWLQSCFFMHIHVSGVLKIEKLNLSWVLSNWGSNSHPSLARQTLQQVNHSSIFVYQSGRVRIRYKMYAKRVYKNRTFVRMRFYSTWLIICQFMFYYNRPIVVLSTQSFTFEMVIYDEHFIKGM